MDNLWQDIRYALRTLKRNPGVIAAAILALGLSIGVNTAIFSAVDAVLLEPLPYRDARSLVRVWGTNEQVETASARSEFEDSNLSPNDFFDLRERAQSFAAITVSSGGGQVTMTGAGEPARLRAPFVSTDFFSVFDVQPHLGRFFTRDDEEVGKHRVVVLSYECWRDRFGSRPDIAGQNVIFNGNPFTVIGVAPPGFRDPMARAEAAPDVWRPLPQPDPGDRGGHWLHGVARLKPGVTLETAQTELAGITAQLSRQYPETNTGVSVRLTSLHHALTGRYRPALLVLFIAVGFVLLIACANVANLLLARATAREREIAVRLALGAGRGRIVRQLLTESLLLGLASGALGLLLAMWVTDFFAALAAGEIPRLRDIQVDFRMLGFTAGVSLLTGIIFGLAPALRVTRPDVQEALRDGGRGLGAGSRHNRFRRALVVAEVAMAVVLLSGAGLMMKSFWRLQQVDKGYDPENLLTLAYHLPMPRYSEEQVVAFHDRLTERIQAMPGVESVGMVNMLPLSGNASCDSFTIEGRPVKRGEEPCVEVRSASPGYFEAMGIALQAGRLINDRDRMGTPPVVVVNESMSRTYFPGENPIGKRINLAGFAAPVWSEIVGVVSDVRHFGVAEAPRPEVYQPVAQTSYNLMTLTVRARIPAETLTASIRQTIRKMDAELPVFNVRTMNELVSRAVAQPRFRTLLLAFFAGLALLLTVIGIYGVLAYMVSQRTHEIGVRMALGARAGDVLAMILKQGLGLIVAGLAIGLCASLLLTRWFESLLFEVSATDPMTYAGISLVLIVVALLACLIPARRATRVDPMEALRYE